MVVDIGESIENFGDKILKNNRINSILINPLTYAVSVCIIIIIVMCLCHIDDKFHYIYAGIAVFGILLVSSMLSHQAIRNKVSKEYGIKKYDDIVGEGETLNDEEYNPAVPRISDLNFN